MCGVLGTWILVIGVSAPCVVLREPCPGLLGSRSPVCPLGVLRCVCGVLGQSVSVHRSIRSVRCVACAASCATWLLFTGVLARCVVLRVPCPGPVGSCSPVCSLSALCCFRDVLVHLAPVCRCALSVRCIACAVSWATWLLFTGVLAPCVVLRVPCPGPLDSCSLVCPLSLLCCVCGVLGHLDPVHRCACSVRCVACAVSWATWLLFTGVPARCVVLCVRCPRPFGSCLPMCSFGALYCVCCVLGHLAPVQRCACSVRCVVCAVSWATWLLFTGVPARCVVFRVRCPGQLSSFSPVCLVGVLCCVCGVPGHWFLFTGVLARCVVLRVRCPEPPGSCSAVCPLGAMCSVCGVLGLFGSCSPVCPLAVLCGMCGVLGKLVPVHRCIGSVR